jgi:broad specificity phosphatase PhoE
MSRRLVFVRHAESTANADNSLTCAIPGVPLSPRGTAQAAALARDWDEPVRAIWSSPMRRALQTAQPLADRLGLPVRVHERLYEFQIGDLHGRTDPASAALVDECFRRWQQGDELDFRPPGGESGAEIVARIRAALLDILAELTDGTAVVVGHGTALRTALCRLAAGLSAADTVAHELPNTGRIVVEVDDTAPNGLAVRSSYLTRGAGTR